MAKKHLSHDQKRKAKLARRASKAPPVNSLAYTGNKFKTDELVPVFLSTETGIYESSVVTEQALTDADVQAALQELVLQLRHGPLTTQEYSDKITYTEGDEKGLVISNIRRNWIHMHYAGTRVGTEQLVGVLRTLLGSIEAWRSPSAQSRGYLHYLEGFLKKAGVKVDAYSSDFEPVPEPAEEKLLTIGRPWAETGDPEAAERFRALADRMIRGGEGEQVVEACQRLIEETAQGPAFAELSAYSLMAQQALKRSGVVG